MSKKQITVLTATLGRDSLAEVAKEMESQTARDEMFWLVIGDGKEAANKARVLLAGTKLDYQVVEAISTEGPKWQYGMLFRTLWKVTTPMVCIVDDDNSFSADHVQLLIEGLKQHPFVATNRVYCDPAGGILGSEAPTSELVDSNNAGYTTKLFKQIEQAWRKFGANPAHCDRDMQCFAQLMGVWPKRIAKYTVNYRINTKRVSEGMFRCAEGESVFETLGGRVFKVR